MELESLIESAAGGGASDLHLEAGMPAAVRVRGALQVSGEPVPPRALAEIARRLIGEEQWPVFLERRSFDLSKTIRGVRCRIICRSLYSQSARSLLLCRQPIAL